MTDGNEWPPVKVNGAPQIFEVKCDPTNDSKRRYILKICPKDKTKIKKKILVIMLNPSNANEKKPDYTCRALINLCDSNSYNLITIWNLFSLRTPDVEELNEKINDANDNQNNEKLRLCIGQFDEILCAWGRAKEIKDMEFYNDRIDQVYHDMLKGKNLKKFGDEFSFKDKAYPTHPRRYYFIKSRNKSKIKFTNYKLE